jgi:hypothetical protein
MPYAKASLVLVIVLAGAAACHTVDVTGTPNTTCTSAVITAGNGTTDFKQRIPKQTAVAPADSILDVVLTFVSAVTQSDRDRIGSYNGTNIASAGSANTVRAEFMANDLMNYVATDTGRLTDATIYIPACTNK